MLGWVTTIPGGNVVSAKNQENKGGARPENSGGGNGKEFPPKGLKRVGGEERTSARQNFLNEKEEQE